MMKSAPWLHNCLATILWVFTLVTEVNKSRKVRIGYKYYIAAFSAVTAIGTA